MSDEEDLYPCVGICQLDPDSGYCIGCGRPPLASPAPAVSPVTEPSAPTGQDAESTSDA